MPRSLAAVGSALLLILAFPRFSFWPCVWIAFVPIFYQLRRSANLRSAFFYFYLLGALFFLVTWEWLRHVTYFGWLFLAFGYAFYFGLFGFFVFWFWSRKQHFLSLFALPSVWAVLEWIRTEIPVWGFGWNLLAYSQASNLPLAGIAGFIGAYGLSWLIMFVNLAFLFLFEFLLKHRKENGFLALFSFLFLGVVLSLYFGFYEKRGQVFPTNNVSDPPHILAGKPVPVFSAQAETIRIATVQGNIPQEGKWNPKNKDAILKVYEGLSRFVPAEGKPDLMVWPEAAFPGYFNLDPERARILRLAKELEVPILLGSPHLELLPGTDEREIPYNSAYLISPQQSSPGLNLGYSLNGGPAVERYDKVHLVSFGEYVPWRFLFGPLGLERFAYSLGVSDFEAGKDVKVFSLKENGKEKSRFSVLICFEDTFPFLARRSAEKGAEFLVVITNDAWFGKSAAPYQHLQASVFRAIENGIPVIRSANTGVSAFIDREGMVTDRVKDRHGNDTFIAGGLIRPVELSIGAGLKPVPTVYRKWGYQFPIYCLVFVLVSFIFSWKVKGDL